MKNKKRASVIILIIVPILISLIIIVTIATIFLLMSHIEFDIIGQEYIILNYLDNYEEEGAIVKSCNYFSCTKLNLKINIIGKVDTSKIGTYEIIYELKTGNKKYIQKRVVDVIEKEPPVIELYGDTILNMCPNQYYDEKGYKATDNYDGDITNKVIKEIIDDKLYYKVTDSSLNEGIATRKFVYNDKENPKISLKGSDKIYIEAGSKYEDSGYIVSDNCDASIFSKVKMVNNVDTSQAGVYNVIYTVSDTSGNTSSVTREVIVYNFNTKSVEEYTKSLEYYIQSKNYKVSLGYVNLVNEYTYLYNPDKIYYGASLIKTLDALYVYEKLEITDNLKQLVSKAISISDNAAHKKLVETIGFNNLKNFGQSLGAKNVLNRGSSDYFGNTNINDQIIYMKYLYQFINNNPNGKELQSYFINDYCNYISFEGSPEVMHKYGFYGNYFHESAIVLEQNKPYIIIILTEEGNNNYKDKIQDLSIKIYNLNKLT